jgi:hypothetical protein
MLKKVKLKHIINTYNPKNDTTYDWDNLRNSLKKDGYDLKRHIPIIIIKFYKEYYLCLDGNHRIFMLKELYGEEYEINVEIKTFIKQYIDIILSHLFITYFFLKKIFFIYKYHNKKLYKHI